MSKSALLKSSIAKKYWMALTGLFLCTFLIGHLIGNTQLFIGGEEGKQAFNEYAYFMTHNIFIKILSYLTYISILFHAIDGLMLAVQNKRARPVPYASNNARSNSKFASRNMALLGSLILIFIVTHMANFWWKMKFSSKEMPLHTISVEVPGQMGMPEKQEIYYTHTLSIIPKNEDIVIKHGTQLYMKQLDVKVGEGYKDLHSLVYAFFGHDRSEQGFPKNDYALIAVIAYVISMIVLAYHLMHGFASAFQSLGMRHPAYTRMIAITGNLFAVLICLGFAIIPVYIFSLTL